MGRKRTKPDKIRLTEVAKLAGVSPITVSRFFRSPEALSAGKRVRVESAANELGYVPKQFPQLTEAQRQEAGEFLQSIEDHDDVHRVWAALK